jgi:hypothetical protein
MLWLFAIAGFSPFVFIAEGAENLPVVRQAQREAETG